MASDASSSTHVVEIDVYEGRPKTRVDLSKAAPFGWGVVLLLGVVAMVDRIDSSLVGGSYDVLQKYFGFNDLVGGILLATPVWASLLLVVPAGVWADTKPRTRLIGVVTASWGLLTFGAAAAPTLAVFFLARFALGAATPLNIPASSSLTGDLFPATSRVKAFGILRAMEYLGLPLGVAIGGVVGGTLGWRWAFALMGIPALIVAVIVSFRLREPRRGVGDELSALIDANAPDDDTDVLVLPESELPDDIALGLAGETESVPPMERMRRVMRIRSARYIVLGQALLFAGFAGLFSFTTHFFHDTHGLTEQQAAPLTGGLGLVFLLVGAGYVIGRRGRVSDIRSGSRVRVPAWCFVVSVVSVAIFAGINVLPIQLIAFSALNLANIIAITNLSAAIADVIPAHERGSGFAVNQFFLTVGSGCGSVIVGLGSFLAGDNIRVGVAALVIPLAIGTALIFKATRTYQADAARVIAAVEV